MTLFKDPRKEIRDLGRADAVADQDHADDFVIMTQGLRPVLRPTVSLEQAIWMRESSTAQLDGWTEDLHAAQEALVDHQPRWLLVFLLVLVCLVEFESGILYWKDEGVTGITRLVLAAATAGTSIFLPWLLIEFGKQATALLNQRKEQP